MSKEYRLTKFVVATAALLGSGFTTTTQAAEMGMATGTMITITSPTDGAKLSATGENKMEYDITLGSGDDHFHVWIDGEKGPAQRELKGTYVLPKMTPGQHAVIVKIVDKAHVPTGPEKRILVQAE